MPGASILTKVIIMAASGNGGAGMFFGKVTFSSRVFARLVQGQLGRQRGLLLGVGDGGLVAMMAIGDDELLVGHGGDDEVDQVGVGDLPDAVDYAVLIGDGEVGGRGVFRVLAASEDEFIGHEPGVGVEHVDLLAA